MGHNNYLADSRLTSSPPSAPSLGSRSPSGVAPHSEPPNRPTIGSLHLSDPTTRNDVGSASIDSTSSWIMAESMISRGSSSSSIAPLLSATAQSPTQPPHTASDSFAQQQKRTPHPLMTSLASCSTNAFPLTRPSSPVSSDEGHSVASSARGRPARARSSTETSDSGQSDNHDHRLVMPSITLRHQPPPSASSAAEPPILRSRILIVGKTRNERLTLARLLAHDRSSGRQPQSDMEASFVSTKPSEASSGSYGADKWVSRTAEQSSHATFWHPTPTAVNNPTQLVDWVGHPLEALEAKINRAYPQTDILAGLVGSALSDELTAALFLFSAREWQTRNLFAIGSRLTWLRSSISSHCVRGSLRSRTFISLAIVPNHPPRPFAHRQAHFGPRLGRVGTAHPRRRRLDRSVRQHPSTA